MKLQILQKIFDHFDDWSQQFPVACVKGCAVCCTQNVTMTTVEGTLLFNFIKENKKESWLSEKLELLPDSKVQQTTNEFAKACLNGEETEIAEGTFDAVCPFLENNLCAVYPARPFACRCFASTITCSQGQSALLPTSHLSAATTLSQIIEHLDQFNPWGNMLHILYLLADESEALHLRSKHDRSALRDSCLTAQPLPGFLIGEEEAGIVVPLIETIFQTVVKGRTIEDILNNR